MIPMLSRKMLKEALKHALQVSYSAPLQVWPLYLLCYVSEELSDE